MISQANSADKSKNTDLKAINNNINDLAIISNKPPKLNKNALKKRIVNKRNLSLVFKLKYQNFRVQMNFSICGLLFQFFTIIWKNLKFFQYI